MPDVEKAITYFRKSADRTLISIVPTTDTFSETWSLSDPAAACCSSQGGITRRRKRRAPQYRIPDTGPGRGRPTGNPGRRARAAGGFQVSSVFKAKAQAALSVRVNARAVVATPSPLGRGRGGYFEGLL